MNPHDYMHPWTLPDNDEREFIREHEEDDPFLGFLYALAFCVPLWAIVGGLMWWNWPR